MKFEYCRKDPSHGCELIGIDSGLTRIVVFEIENAVICTAYGDGFYERQIWSMGI